jgi:hypothetical protein
MSGWRSQLRVRSTILGLCAAALLAGWLASGQIGKAARKGDRGSLIAREATAPPKQLSGRLSWHDDLPVLELWGDPEAAGYAHGWLLAADIVALFDGYVLDKAILPDPAVFDGMLRPSAMRVLVWPTEVRAEITALHRGMVDRLGSERVRSTILGRAIVVEDLLTVNAFADFHCVMCSSFSAWGAMTESGQTITGRNLDFPKTEVMERRQVVIARRGEAGRHGWIGVSWPGLIGVYTAMNDAGVTILMHDAPGLPRSGTDAFTARSLILREALEDAGSQHFLADVRRVLEKRRVMVGNNIHVSGPRNGADVPAGVFEYDGNARDGGVWLRQADQSAVAARDFLVATNQMRCRQPPGQCERYRTLSDSLESTARVDSAAAFRMLNAVRQDDTLHSVVCLPDAGEIRVQIPALTTKLVDFRVREWLNRATIGRGTPATR